MKEKKVIYLIGKNKMYVIIKYNNDKLWSEGQSIKCSKQKLLMAIKNGKNWLCLDGLNTVKTGFIKLIVDG